VIRLLLLEDDRDLREEVSEFLGRYGIDVSGADSIGAFWQAFRHSRFDVAVIDRMLPDGDGMDVVRVLREEASTCGVVVFTSLDAERDRIEGYRHGADHYLTKPVQLDELSAVVQSLCRRIGPSGSWCLDVVEWKLLTPDQVEVELTGQQAAFISALVQARGQVVSRRALVEAIGKRFNDYEPRNLDTLVMRLRSKVEAVSTHRLPVKTRHGAGYQLTVPFRVDSSG
jgi:DNA-binding response OmpR family regulator